MVSGLRDPLARDPATLLPQHRLAADAVAGRWELYQALHPALVLARARHAARAAGGVTAPVPGRRACSADGPRAGRLDRDRACRLAPVIPGVTRFDASRPIDAALGTLAAAIEAAMPMFVKGIDDLRAGRRADRPRSGRPAGRRSTRWDAAASGASRWSSSARPTRTAPPTQPAPERASRRPRARRLLQAQRLDRVTLDRAWRRQPIGRATRRADEADKQRNRRVVVPCHAAPPIGDNPATMLHNKICMLGGFGVGKTSLVSRFVSSIFSDTLPHDGGRQDRQEERDRSMAATMTLMLWDIYGQDEFQTRARLVPARRVGLPAGRRRHQARHARNRGGAAAPGRIGRRAGPVSAVAQQV